MKIYCENDGGKENDEEQTAPDDNFITYRYPFQTLPLLESHLHPNFIIFNAGCKVDSLSQSDMLSFTRLTDAFPHLLFIQNLYCAWIVMPGKMAMTVTTTMMTMTMTMTMTKMMITTMIICRRKVEVERVTVTLAIGGLAC